jgi:hypothetical protein
VLNNVGPDLSWDLNKKQTWRTIKTLGGDGTTFFPDETDDADLLVICVH